MATRNSRTSRYLACNADGMAYIETIIGAAIWYLPFDSYCWTGNISVGALEFCRKNTPGTRLIALTKDHEFPRKLAARALLRLNWDEIANPGEELLQRFRSHYGRFNYVTTNENRRLMQHQKQDRFTDVVQAYRDAGIVLITISEEELRKVRRGYEELIADILVRQY